MFIQTESTPNPATLKFLPGQTVLELGTADFPNVEAAAKSPLARRIFAAGGVTGVFFGSDFVTVTKAEDVDWQHIKPAILGAIMEHYQSGAAVMEGEAKAAGGHAEHSGEDADIVRQIKELLDTRVRPRWRRMAATSPSTALTGAWSTCTCRAPARAARPAR